MEESQVRISQVKRLSLRRGFDY